VEPTEPGLTKWIITAARHGQNTPLSEYDVCMYLPKKTLLYWLKSISFPSDQKGEKEVLELGELEGRHWRRRYWRGRV
jgi:hypothetical protein